MKYCFNIILTVAMLTFISSVAIAADETILSSKSENEATPVVLISPETVIDTAIKAPQKTIVEDKKESKVEPAAKHHVEKKVVLKKRSIHKAKKSSKNKYIKRYPRKKNVKKHAEVKNDAITAIDESIAK